MIRWAGLLLLVAGVAFVVVLARDLARVEDLNWHPRHV